MSSNKIRPIAICICSFENKILIIDYFDFVKKEKYYRSPGGGINFGEFGKDAVIREFKEEVNLDLMNVEFLAFYETIFECDGNQEHQIVLVYDAQLVDSTFYNTILHGYEDDGNTYVAFWKSIDEIEKEKIPLYPIGLLDLIKKRNWKNK